MHLEWFPTYAARFLGSRKVRRMRDKHIGVYWMLLLDEWISGALENDLDILADIAKSDPETVEYVLKLAFTLTEDGWINTALEEIRAEQETKHERLSLAGKKGGKVKPKPKARQPLTSQAQARLKQADKPGLSQAEAIERERERIERVEEATRTHEDLISFLGDGAKDLLADFCLRCDADEFTLKSLWGTFGPKGIQGERIFRDVPEADRPKAMAGALNALMGEGEQYKQHFFRAVLETNCKPFRPGGDATRHDFGDEGQRDRARANKQQGRVTTEYLRTQDDEAKAAAEELAEMKAWFREQSPEDQRDINTEAEKRARAIKAHGTIPKALATGCLTKVIEEWRQEGAA